MTERFSLQDAGYVLYSDMLARLHQRFPGIPEWRIAQVVAAENDAITGGVLRIVPEEVETGAKEMLEREHTRVHESGEVA